MSPTILRLLGFIFLFAAAASAILNLKRVANLEMPWLAPLFIVVGAAFIAFSRRRTNG